MAATLFLAWTVPHTGAARMGWIVPGRDRAGRERGAAARASAGRPRVRARGQRGQLPHPAAYGAAARPSAADITHVDITQYPQF